MVDNSLRKKLDAVESKYDDNFPYEMGAEAVEKIKVRTQHMCEKWKDFLRFYSFNVSDLILGPLKERNMKKGVREAESFKGEYENFLEERKVMGWSDSMNGVMDATDELIKTRAQEIKKWLIENVSFQKIWETIIEGIDKFPRINMPDMSLFLGKEDEEKYL